MQEHDIGLIQAFFATNDWVWADYAIAVILIISAISGFFRGFIKEALALVIWFLAIWITMHFGADLAGVFQNKISNSIVRIFTACVLLFISTLMVGGIINYIVSKILQKTGLSIMDRFLGLGFGTFRACLFVSILVMLASFSHLPDDLWWKQSKLLPSFQSLAEWLKNHIPANLIGYINYR